MEIRPVRFGVCTNPGGLFFYKPITIHEHFALHLTNLDGEPDTAYAYGNERLTVEQFTGCTGFYTCDPLTLNRYNYVKSSYLNYVDSSGCRTENKELFIERLNYAFGFNEETGDMMIRLFQGKSGKVFLDVRGADPSLGLYDYMSDLYAMNLAML